MGKAVDGKIMMEREEGRLGKIGTCCGERGDKEGDEYHELNARASTGEAVIGEKLLCSLLSSSERTMVSSINAWLFDCLLFLCDCLVASRVTTIKHL